MKRILTHFVDARHWRRSTRRPSCSRTLAWWQPRCWAAPHPTRTLDQSLHTRQWWHCDPVDHPASGEAFPASRWGELKTEASNVKIMKLGWINAYVQRLNMYQIKQESRQILVQGLLYMSGHCSSVGRVTDCGAGVQSLIPLLQNILRFQWYFN